MCEFRLEVEADTAEAARAAMLRFLDSAIKQCISTIEKEREKEINALNEGRIIQLTSDGDDARRNIVLLRNHRRSLQGATIVVKSAEAEFAT